MENISLELLQDPPSAVSNLGNDFYMNGIIDKVLSLAKTIGENAFNNKLLLIFKNHSVTFEQYSTIQNNWDDISEFIKRRTNDDLFMKQFKAEQK